MFKAIKKFLGLGDKEVAFQPEVQVVAEAAPVEPVADPVGTPVVAPVKKARKAPAKKAKKSKAV